MLERITEDTELVKALREAKNHFWTQPQIELYPMMEDAADAIEELISRLPKWISVNERLPEESGGYLAYIQEPHMIQKADWEEQYDFSFVMQLWFDKQKMLWSDNGEDSYNAYLPVVDTDNAFHVTHWMKLPEPPKGE